MYYIKLHAFTRITYYYIELHALHALHNITSYYTGGAGLARLRPAPPQRPQIPQPAARRTTKQQPLGVGTWIRSGELRNVV